MVRLHRRPRTLRRALKKTETKQQCRMVNCPLRSDICLRKMVVYKVACVCGASYIGSTTRHLHTRIKEHHRTPTSAIYRHRLLCDGNHVVTVLCNAKDAVELRLKEAIKISVAAPELNDRGEGKELCSILYAWFKICPFLNFDSFSMNHFVFLFYLVPCWGLCQPKYCTFIYTDFLFDVNETRSSTGYSLLHISFTKHAAEGELHSTNFFSVDQKLSQFSWRNLYVY